MALTEMDLAMDSFTERKMPKHLFIAAIYCPLSLKMNNI